MNEKRVFGLGHLVIDKCLKLSQREFESLNLIPEGRIKINSDKVKLLEENFNNRIEKTIGGSVGNTIRLLSKLGVQGVLASAVGNDSVSEWLSSQLSSYQVQNNLTPFCGKSGECFTLSLDNGEKTMLFHPGVSHHLSLSTVNFNSLNECHYFYSSFYMAQTKEQYETLLEGIKLANKNKIPIGIDLAHHEVVHNHRNEIIALLEDGHIDHLFANVLEIEALFGHDYKISLWNFLKKGACTIFIIKDGDKGSTLYHREFNKPISVPASKVDAFDGTGAGDAYASAFIHAYLKNIEIEKVAHFASKAASLVIRNHGVDFKEQDLTILNKLLSYFLILLVFFFNLNSLSAKEATKFLFIHSYPPSEWPQMITSGAVEELQKNFKNPISYKEISLSNELLDKVFAKFVPENMIKYKIELDQFKQNVEKIINDFKPNYLIVSDDEALYTIQSVLPNLSQKIFFTGINSNFQNTSTDFIDKKTLTSYSYIEEEIPFESTLSAIQKFSKIKNILFLTSESFTSQILVQNLRAKKKLMLQKTSIINADFKMTSNFNEWKRVLKYAHKKNDLLVILIPYHIMDEEGKEVSLQKIGSYLKNHLKIPSLGISPIHIKMGVLMGVSPSPYFLGKQVAEIISLNELNEKSRQKEGKLGPIKNFYNHFEVNKEMLAKFPLFYKSELSELIKLQTTFHIREKEKDYVK